MNNFFKPKYECAIRILLAKLEVINAELSIELSRPVIEMCIRDSNKAPYENVIVLGHVQDENGQKMSKSKGNAVDPFEALETYGADAIRWYFYINSAPWLPNRFHGKAVMEGQRKFMGTLWNTYAFFVLYANIDNFDACLLYTSRCV